MAVASMVSSTFDDFGYVPVSSIVAPDKADEVDTAIAAVTRTLRTAPVTADLLDRALQPMLENAAKSLRQNGYWLGLVGEAQTDAAKLNRPRTRETVIRSITAADLQAMANQYLRDDKLQRVRIVSDKLAGKAIATR